jgi:hypothetical protein
MQEHLAPIAIQMDLGHYPRHVPHVTVMILQEQQTRTMLQMASHKIVLNVILL